ncbi:MAG TPA: protein-methionine-sulfoxide reductase catalytic subunit MsrP [Stellaceae bacterium]|nr:protein-methionine-sulfoxide reductase catalytic subunit MsrP [Stellaceae bacterium]
MLIKRKRGWEIPEREATSESVFNDRRRLIKAMGLSAIGAAAAATRLSRLAFAADEGAPDPSAGLYPVKRNETYALDRPITPEKLVETYNNFYEFGSQKEISDEAQGLKIRPWTVEIDGMVEQPITIDIDDLLKKMPLEERLYRHRCVEAWSIAAPWSGFPMKALVDFAKPLGSAKFVRTQSFQDAKVASGQKAFWYPWPYIEGVTIEEATNDVAFLVTGLYGKPLPKQNGAPLRMELPWKYGFKSAKSIVKFTFTDKRPVSFWTTLQGSEYGFWANVNPEVPHPRWSQASERVLGTNERRPTLLYNGYGEFVASLYAGLKDEKLFM